MRTMARGTSGTVRELALLDGVTHSARSPVCLIKHHAGAGVCAFWSQSARCVWLSLSYEQPALFFATNWKVGRGALVLALQLLCLELMSH